MFNLFGLIISQKNPPAQQAADLVAYIDQYLPLASPETFPKVLALKEHVTKLCGDSLTESTVEEALWVLQDLLPPYLHIDSDDGDTEFKAYPDLDRLYDDSLRDLGWVATVDSGDEWPEDCELGDKAEFVVRGWDAPILELFDRATRRVVWTYQFEPEYREATEQEDCEVL